MLLTPYARRFGGWALVARPSEVGLKDSRGGCGDKLCPPPVQTILPVSCSFCGFHRLCRLFGGHFSDSLTAPLLQPESNWATHRPQIIMYVWKGPVFSTGTRGHAANTRWHPLSPPSENGPCGSQLALPMLTPWTGRMLPRSRALAWCLHLQPCDRHLLCGQLPDPHVSEGKRPRRPLCC